MISMVKPYLYGALAVLLLGAIAFSYSNGRASGKAEVQAKFDAYKENINDQLSKAVTAKAKLEAEQNAKFLAAKLDYSDARRNLDSILARLRDGTFVLGGETLPVAGNSPGGVSGKTTDTSKLVVTPRTFSGTCGFDFYAAALRDNLRCQALIDFVKP